MKKSHWRRFTAGDSLIGDEEPIETRRLISPSRSMYLFPTLVLKGEVVMTSLCYVLFKTVSSRWFCGGSRAGCAGIHPFVKWARE